MQSKIIQFPILFQCGQRASYFSHCINSVSHFQFSFKQIFNLMMLLEGFTCVTCLLFEDSCASGILNSACDTANDGLSLDIYRAFCRLVCL